jgi:hypothetical protein
MKYRYIAVYQIRGLIHVPDRGDVEIYADGDGFSVRAILTERVDEYCYELDRARSLGYLVLKSLAGQRESDTLRVEVEAEVSRIRERRNKDLSRSEVLIFTADGEVEPDFSRPSRETDDFVLGFEVVNKDNIVGAHSAQMNAALAALCLSTEHDTIQVKRVQGDVYLINESGKPVYSLDFSASGDAFVSRRTSDAVIREAQSQAVALTSEKSLARVNRLLVQAISSENDKLRRFMFGWSALEIFINKVFSEYERLCVQNLLGTDPASHTQRYFERIHDVMRDKYRITDKFVVVTACLGDDSIETDVETFASIKKSRDELLHGEVLDEDSLPVAETIKLLKKYLRLHISMKAD